MSNKTEIKSIVEKNEHLREYLFTRGFIFTNNQSINAILFMAIGSRLLSVRIFC